MTKYLIGIDNGGSDIKCAIFDNTGNEIAVASAQVPLSIPAPGFTERDPEQVWQANVAVVRDAIAKAGISGAEIAAIGLTGYGNGLVFVDAQGHAVYPAIVSTDDRAAEYCARFRAEGIDRALFPAKPPGPHSLRRCCPGSGITPRRSWSGAAGFCP